MIYVMQKKIICIDYLRMNAQGTDNRLGGNWGSGVGENFFTIYLFWISFERNFLHHVHALHIQKC